MCRTPYSDLLATPASLDLPSGMAATTKGVSIPHGSGSGRREHDRTPLTAASQRRDFFEVPTWGPNPVITRQRITTFNFMVELPTIQTGNEFNEATEWGQWKLRTVPGWEKGQQVHGKAVGVMVAAGRLKEDAEKRPQQGLWHQGNLEGVNVGELPSHAPVGARLRTQQSGSIRQARQDDKTTISTETQTEETEEVEVYPSDEKRKEMEEERRQKKQKREQQRQ